MPTINGRALALAGIVLECGVAALQPPSIRAQAGPGAIRIAFDSYKLSNGLTVVLSPDHRTPTVAVNLWYHVGSKNESRGRTGFAHLFEHVMFTGSAHVPYGLRYKLTEGVGGANNGTTSNDRTTYHETVPSNYLEAQVWLEADRMGFLLDTLDIAKINAHNDQPGDARAGAAAGLRGSRRGSAALGGGRLLIVDQRPGQPGRARTTRHQTQHGEGEPIVVRPADGRPQNVTRRTTPS